MTLDRKFQPHGQSKNPLDFRHEILLELGGKSETPHQPKRDRRADSASQTTSSATLATPQAC